MSSINGLPPVPQSLTPFLFNQPKDSVNKSVRPLPRSPPREPPPPPPLTASLQRKPSGVSSSLDAKLQVLRREMTGLRQLDMLLMHDYWPFNSRCKTLKLSSINRHLHLSTLGNWEFPSTRVFLSTKSKRTASPLPPRPYQAQKRHETFHHSIEC